MRSVSWTSDQLRQWEAEHGPSVQVAKPSNVKPWAPYRSKTEAAYADYLNLMIKADHIGSWKYEAVTLTLAPGVRYCPDFACNLLCDGGISFHEVKGRKNQTFWSQPVGKVKVRLAAVLFPWWRFYVVWPGERIGTWEKLLVPSK